jgi:hypothetical protein
MKELTSHETKSKRLFLFDFSTHTNLAHFQAKNLKTHQKFKVASSKPNQTNLLRQKFKN